MTLRLKKLDQAKWELALKVVSNAWDQADSPMATFCPPKELKHLKPEDWEEVCQVLWTLIQQREQSPVH